MIAPIFIACGKRYGRLATISAESFLKYHDVTLYVVVDREGREELKKSKGLSKHKNLCLVPIGNYDKRCEKDVKMNLKTFHSWDFNFGQHNRVYSSLKPLIMDKVISDYSPDSKYILSLDADSIFTGNILNKVRKELNKVKHGYDLYMVERTDPRMMLLSLKKPGSGFTLWKRDSNFIKLFSNSFKGANATFKGGSQSVINNIFFNRSLPSMLLKDPFLHFVSPDKRYKKNHIKYNEMKLTDKNILSFRPAYIHLHGTNCYKRLKRFKNVFDKEDKNVKR
jgi:lipopolysaccharide biosynthesis glycosyltransferase